MTNTGVHHINNCREKINSRTIEYENNNGKISTSGSSMVAVDENHQFDQIQKAKDELEAKRKLTSLIWNKNNTKNH